MHTDAHAVSALGLDPAVRGCLFDLDGVLTGASALHAEAWKKTFDSFLRAYDLHSLRRDRPFDERADYAGHLAGRLQDEGIRAFLRSREIEVPEGDADDAPGTETVRGIAAAKQWAFLSLLEARGPQAHEGSVRYVRAVRDAGLKRAAVTASGHGAEVLEAAGIADLFDAVADGTPAAGRGLSGRPVPDAHLTAAGALGLEPAAAAAFESSLAGVAAARAGGIGTVVGVDRFGGDDVTLFRESGADVVVTDLADLLAPRAAAAARDAEGSP